MTDHDHDPGPGPDFARTVPAHLTRPTTVQGHRQLSAYICMSQLQEMLNLARASMRTALAAAEAMPEDSSASAVQAAWKTSLAELNITFAATDLHGRTAIRAVKLLVTPE